MTSKPKYSRKQRTAYHEAAHVVVGHYCRYAPAIRKVTIIETNEAYGHVAPFQESSFNPEVKPDLRKIADRITVLLAGNEATRQLTGRYDNRGAVDDSDQAVDLAMRATNTEEEAAAMLRWLRVRAKDLVRVRWLYVRAVAVELLERAHCLAETLSQSSTKNSKGRWLREGRTSPPVTSSEPGRPS